MPRTLITTPTFGRFSDEPWRCLKAAGEVVRPHETHQMPADELLRRVPEADALIVGMDAINAEVLDAAPRLRIVAKHGVGVDTIDVLAARERGVHVTCAPGSNSRAVAELTFGGLLGAARQLGQSHAAVAHCEWPKLYGPELAGKTVGIIGFGRIGRLVAGYARAFGMSVQAHDPYLDAATIAEYGVSPADLPDCVSTSDFLSLHSPGEPHTAPVLDRAALRSMKQGAVLVNTARGGLVDESALAEALHDGHIGAAAIDVFNVEPPTGNPLLQAPRTLLTSHLGACSHEANQAMGEIVAGDVARALRGEEPRYAAT